MSLGTRGGNLLLRNSLLQTGCECCLPPTLCACAGFGSQDRLPSSFVVETSDLAFEFVSQSGQLDMTGREQDLADLASNRTIDIDLVPAQSVQGSFAAYAKSSGNECLTTAGNLTLACNQQITSFSVNSVIGRFCEDDVPGGRLGCSMTTLLAWSTSLTPASMPRALAFCSDPQPDSKIVFTSPAELIYAQWLCAFVGFSPTSVGRYRLSSGSVTVTPVYGNPLP